MNTQTETPIITRAQYMSGQATHREYYGQFVDAGVRANVETRFGKKLLKGSTDEHLNDIPLKHWDCLWSAVPARVASKMRAAGDYPTMAGSVCILKEAARQIIEASNA